MNDKYEWKNKIEEGGIFFRKGRMEMEKNIVK